MSFLVNQRVGPFNMNFQLIFLAAVCSLIAGAAAQKSGNPPLSETEKFLSNGVNSFAIHLLKNVHNTAKAEENILISPMNIYAALALVHLGSAGTTRNELAQVMGLPQDDSRARAIHESFSQMSKKLQHKSTNLNETISEVTMANGMFVQQDYPVKEKYVKVIKSYYEGNVSNLDFSAQGATDSINQWVSEKTKGRIPKLFTEPLGSETRIVLASSLYFSGKWLDSFPGTLTRPEKFNTGVRDIEVQMMNNNKMVRYVSSSEWKSDAIVLPYQGGDFHMLIILPHPTQTLKNLTDHLNDVDKLHGIVKKTEIQGVDYRIPRMKFSWKESMKEPLQSHGLNTIFRHPDLSNMLSSSNLQVSDVHHATEMEVNEKGTTASAVTVVPLRITGGSSPPKYPIKFHLNRPFIMHIYYQPKHVILFSGIIHEPVGH